MSNTLRPAEKHHGLSLVELLVVTLIIGILLSVATPSLQRQVLQYRLERETASLLDLLRLARLQAVKESTGYIVCASRDQMRCSTQVGDWRHGALLTAANGEIKSALQPATDIVIDNNARAQIIFNGSGWSPAGMSSFSLCAKNVSLPHYRIALSLSGKATAEKRFISAPCGT